MGVATSRGTNNIQLVDNLVNSDSIESPSVELVFRVIDRGLFIPKEQAAQENIYDTGPWRADDDIEHRYGPFHLSSPSIYATVLEQLDLQPGQSFLNIGSGVGYLSSMAGLLLGSCGVSHGVEINKRTYYWSIQKQQDLLQSYVPMCFDWCQPKFFHGSCFKMKLNMKYDRIYVGAKVPQGQRMYFVKMLKVGGICIMPYGTTFQRIHRSTERTFLAYEISNVDFGSLITPNVNDKVKIREIELPNESGPRSLLTLCRRKIYDLIRLHQKEDILIRQKTDQEEEKTIRYPLDPVEDEMLGETHDLRGNDANNPRTNPERDDEGFTIYNLQTIRPFAGHIVELNFARGSDDEDDIEVDQRGIDIRDGVAAAIHVQQRNHHQIEPEIFQNIFEHMLNRVAFAIRDRRTGGPADENNREPRLPLPINPDDDPFLFHRRHEMPLLPPPRSQSAPVQAETNRINERRQILELMSRVREHHRRHASGSSTTSTTSSSPSPSNLTRKRKAPSTETLSEVIFKRVHTFSAPEPFKKSYIRMLPVSTNENTENSEDTTPPSQSIQDDTLIMFNQGVRNDIKKLNLPLTTILQLLYNDSKACDEPHEKDDPME